MHGVTTFGDSAVVVRGRIKTLPGSQWAAGRAYNEIIKKVFNERGIEIPYPHRTIYWGEDKHGEVSPLRIMKERAEEEGEAPALKPSATDWASLSLSHEGRGDRKSTRLNSSH